MKIVDSHTHLFLEEFAEDLPQVIARARECGVTHLFMPNIDRTTIQPLLDTCSAYPDCCFPMMGLHPTSVAADYQDELQVVEHYLKTSRNLFVAIGEIGMDLYWDRTFEREQEEVLRQQLDWALEYNLPVVIHCREAFDNIYKVLGSYRNTSLNGIFHSFTGTVDEAVRIMEFGGFCIGVNGVVTFKKSTLPQVLSEAVPLERMVLETDSPYLAPVPNRGKRNESAYIQHTLVKVAEVYKRSPEEVAEVTTKTALKVFGMLK
ncbi:MAG: TatD family hydrolase [Bacteroides sp.]|nr:TatD family hydrolase [Bacteroides sp.]